MNADQNDMVRQGADLEADVERLPLPRPKREGPPPYVGFPVDALPDVLRDFVNSSAASVHCDSTYVAVPLLAVLASAIGNSRRILLKEDWAEPCILWAAVVGRSGTAKSPALDRATQFAHEHDRAAHSAFVERRAQYEEERQRYEKEVSSWRRVKDDSPPPARPNPPPEARHVVSETTIEALVSLLRDSPRGLLLARDELSAWFGSFGQYKAGGGHADEAQWLEMYGGRPVRVDRKSRDASVYVPRASVSIVGGIQPGVLRACLTDDRIGSGMAARFLMVMPPETPQLWSGSSVSEELTERVRNVFRTLYGLTGASQAADGGGFTPIDHSVSPAGMDLFIQFHDELRREQASLGDAENAATAKFIGVAARLALVLHEVNAAIGPSWPPEEKISADSMARSIQITKWARGEAHRVYAFLSADEAARKEELATDAARQRGGRVTPRELQRAHPKEFPSADVTRKVLSDMAEQGLARREVEGPGTRRGRPSESFVLQEGAATNDTNPSPGIIVDSVSALEHARRTAGGGHD